MRKTTKQFITIGLILLAMYNIILFAIAGFVDHEAPFWVAYTFVMLSFAMTAITAGYLGKSGLVLRDWLFGFPIIRHCAIYVTLSMAASVVFMLLQYDIGWGLPVVVHVLLLGIYAVLMLSCFVSKNAITQVSENVERKTRYIALLQADAQMLSERCEDADVKAKCKKLAEDIRFSDPMSSDVLEPLEMQLKETLADCGKAIDDGDYAMAAELCDQATLQLKERNLKCKALK